MRGVLWSGWLSKLVCLPVLALAALAFPALASADQQYTWVNVAQNSGPQISKTDRPLMAYDSSIARMVLVAKDQTWLYDGSSWTQQGTAPSAANGAMAYDAATNRIVLFDGTSTWLYDGSTWTKQEGVFVGSPEGSSQTNPRFRPAMAYDPKIQKVVLYGGTAGPPVAGSLFCCQDTWLYDGSSWTPQQGASALGVNTDGTAMAYDPSTQDLIAWGGTSNGLDLGAIPPTGNVGAFNGAGWQRVDTTQPLHREEAAMDFDPAVGHLVETDGYAGAAQNLDTVAVADAAGTGNLTSPPAYPADTHYFDGTNWQSLDVVQSAPPSAFPTVAYDPGTQQLLLFTGSTWALVPVEHPTSTSVSCSPQGSTNPTCTATVTQTDTEKSPAGGSVTFTATSGSFPTIHECVFLSAPATCTVPYTPPQSGAANVTAAYAGDLFDGGSTSHVTLQSPTTTTVHCSQLVVDQAENCSATVSDTAATNQSWPHGTISVTASGPGGTFTDLPCTLIQWPYEINGSMANSFCTFTYTPQGTGNAVHTLTATYAPSDGHQASSGSSEFTAAPRSTGASLDCSPLTIELGQTTTCTATVADNAQGTASTPTGTVQFTSADAGTFSSDSCTLSATGGAGSPSSCQVMFTPTKQVFGSEVEVSYPGDSVHQTTGTASPVYMVPAGATSQTFSSPGESQVTIPTGTGQLLVRATGAQGGSQYCYGGQGATVLASLPVTPGQTLYIEVGGSGTDGRYNGGGAGGGNGGGGGASDIRTSPASAGLSPDSRLLVAGGGGWTCAGQGSNAGLSPQAGYGFFGGGAGSGTAGGVPGGDTGTCTAALVRGQLGVGGQGCGTGGGGGGGYYGGGGGGSATCCSGGGGAGSSYVEPGALGSFTTTASGGTYPALADGQVVVTFVPASPPTSFISEPSKGITVLLGKRVTTAFACSEGDGGTGLQSCQDSTGHSALNRAGTGVLDTSTPGSHSYKVTAVSKDGLQATSSINYTVMRAPRDVDRPKIEGTAQVGSTLTCGSGTWTDAASYAYQWSRYGTPIAGATRATYSITGGDQAATLTCTVTGENAAASRTATSGGVRVAYRHVKGCPAASGNPATSGFGRLRLGLSQTRVRRLERKLKRRSHSSEDDFCQTPAGLRVGYPSKALLAGLSAAQRRGLGAMNAVWISTTNPRYNLGGVRVGADLTAVPSALRGGQLVNLKGGSWYVAALKGASVFFKIRHGIVAEIGTVNPVLVSSSAARARFLGTRP